MMQFSPSIIASAALLATMSQALVFKRFSIATLSESTPWKLSNVVAYENAVPANASTNSTEPSHISFHFSDKNPGLNVETDCTRTVAVGETLRDGKFYFCDNTTIRLAWALEEDWTVNIQKGWDDPAYVL
jgi:hypothetical protein